MEAKKFEAPSWLDKDFVQSLLRSNEEDESIVVKDLAVSQAVGKGENYSSCLHRVIVDFDKKDGKTEHRSLIVKSLPESELMAKLMVEEGLFYREEKMYVEMLPALHSLDPGPAGILSTRAYTITRPHTLVMDDLTQAGFKMAERHKGLDLKHSKLAVGALARLHALSLGLVAKDPQALDGMSELFYTTEKREKNKQFLEPGVRLLASYVENWPSFQRFGDKLRDIAWVDRITDLAKVKEGGLVVLNHGDAWTNNFLFRYDESGEVQDIRFVDFQISRRNSPAMDLQYFLHSSPSEEVRNRHWDEVMQHYHTSLVDTLKVIGCEHMAFSLARLKEEFEERMLFGLFTACFILPIVLADPEDGPDLSKMSEDSMEDNVNKADFGKSYNAARFKAVFQQLLLRFEARGIFDKQ